MVVEEVPLTQKLPSDPKLLLTKNYSKIIIFEKLRNFTRNFQKKSFFPGDFESANSLKIKKNNSQGIIFAIVSCQRVKRSETILFPN